ncbi:hypothetical protein [Cereibacter changlensis]|uniref:hypothetical protein n=1 Tax=Cereibacter changlensis TaxID=402884 RepID=UPI004034EE4C
MTRFWRAIFIAEAIAAVRLGCDTWAAAAARRLTRLSERHNGPTGARHDDLR